MLPALAITLSFNAFFIENDGADRLCKQPWHICSLGRFIFNKYPKGKQVMDVVFPQQRFLSFLHHTRWIFSSKTQSPSLTKSDEIFEGKFSRISKMQKDPSTFNKMGDSNLRSKHQAAQNGDVFVCVFIYPSNRMSLIVPGPVVQGTNGQEIGDGLRLRRRLIHLSLTLCIDWLAWHWFAQRLSAKIGKQNSDTFGMGGGWPFFGQVFESHHRRCQPKLLLKSSRIETFVYKIYIYNICGISR